MNKILTLGLLAFSIIGAKAQTNQELNALVKKSFEYYPRIQELEKANEIGEVRVDIARAGYLPSVTGNASYNYVDPVGKATIPVGPGETRSLQFQPNSNVNAYVGLNQVIWDFGRTQAQIQKAKADLQGNQYASDAAHLQLGSQVANIYYGLIYLKRSIEVQDTVIAFYQKNKEIVAARVRQGDALQIDVSNTENSIEQELTRKVEFQRLYARQLALMQYSTGEVAEPTTALFDFQKQSTGTLESGNPDLLASRQRILSAEADEKLAGSNRLPSLNAVANAGVKNGYQPDIDEIRFNYLAGVTLSIPIFQGKRLQQQVALAHKSAEMNTFSTRQLTATLQKDLASAQADEEAYAKQVQHADAQISTSTEALRLSQVRYERGVATYLDLVFASANYQRAVLNKLQFEYQLCLARIEQARLLGRKFWEE